MTKILIVDDQPCVRELVSEELLLEGYRVIMACDAESLRGHLRFSRPDLVLLDLCLDGADGFGVLDDIKKQNPNLPLIIFTAYDGYADDLRPSRADGYVIKSVVFDELKGEIEDVLCRKTVSEALGAKTRCAGLSSA